MKKSNLCLTLLLSSLILSCSDTKKEVAKEQVLAKGELSADLINNPASANGGNTKMLPSIIFSSDTFKFGKIEEGDIVTHDFKFVNAGKAPLIISGADASCGCTVAEYSQEPLAPGKEGSIKVVFNSKGKTGTQIKTVNVLSNSIPNSKFIVLYGEVIKK